MEHYDIFISYRRESYESANLIATRLKAVGYTVFFDLETMRSGLFNEQLYNVIEGCKDFLLVLPPNALDRCHAEDDWVRREVLHAMKHDKNIVPIMLNGFVWPNPMPVGMENLCNYQALTAGSVEFFDMAMERLQRRYLKSRRHLPFGRILKVCSIVCASLMASLLALWGVFSVLSKDVCPEYADMLITCADRVHMIAQDNAKLQKEWNEYATSLKYSSNRRELLAKRQDMNLYLDFTEKSVREMWKIDSAQLEISDYHGFLLSLHGINSQEIAVAPILANMHYSEFLDLLNEARKAVEEPNTLNLRQVTAVIESNTHSLNTYYAATLCELSNFPASARKNYSHVASLWSQFPAEYKIGESEQYYLDIMDRENRKAEEAISAFKSFMELYDAKLDDIEQKVDDLVELKMAVENSAVVTPEQEQELATRKERIALREQEVAASRAKLEKMHKEYEQMYLKLKEKYTIEEEDDQWYKWGKIRGIGKYLSVVVKSRADLRSKGIYSSSPVTPEVINADLSSQLSVYQTYHPESAEYVASTKLFFKEISKGTRTYGGVLIFAFKDDVEHPLFKKGDIVVAYNGQPVTNYAEFKSAYMTNMEGSVTFLRLANGAFEEITQSICHTDIVGFLELTQED